MRGVKRVYILEMLLQGDHVESWSQAVTSHKTRQAYGRCTTFHTLLGMFRNRD
jgi:hypothetical protein